MPQLGIGLVDRVPSKVKSSTSLPPSYGIRIFDWALRTSAIVNPAAIVANRAHPALIVLGPGGL